MWLRFGVYRPCIARHTNITLEYCGTRSRLKKKKCNNDSFRGVSYSHFTRAVNMINVFFSSYFTASNEKKYVRKRRSVGEGQLGYLFHEQ